MTTHTMKQIRKMQNQFKPSEDIAAGRQVGERVWIASYTAPQTAGILSRGLFFRSIHDSKEDAERMGIGNKSRDFTVTEYVLAAGRQEGEQELPPIRYLTPEESRTVTALREEIAKLNNLLNNAMELATKAEEELAQATEVANYWIDEHVEESNRRCAAEQAFEDLRKADQESLTEALAAAIEQMKRAETAEEALARERELNRWRDVKQELPPYNLNEYFEAYLTEEFMWSHPGRVHRFDVVSGHYINNFPDLYIRWRPIEPPALLAPNPDTPREE